MSDQSTAHALRTPPPPEFDDEKRPTVPGRAIAVGRMIASELNDPRDWHEYGGISLIAAGFWMKDPAHGLLALGVGLLGKSLLARGSALIAKLLLRR